jgi:hypothetical protein
MFAAYSVLFIGYSHNDIVMRYLARSLVAGPTRYVLTDNQSKIDWRPLRLTPVIYPIDSGSHVALGEAIAGWAAHASMGLLDHRKRIAQLVASPPPLIPEAVSYLESVIEDVDQARLFTHLARGEEWLRWAATQAGFRSLFDPSTQASEPISALAWWFAQEFVTKAEYTQGALSIVNDNGGRFAPVLWNAIGQNLHIQGSPRPDWLGPWLVLLIQNAPKGESVWLECALTSSRWPEDRTAAVMLFDHLTEPRTRMRSSYGYGSPWFDIELVGSAYELTEAWVGLFMSHLEQVAPDVLAIVDRHLRRAFQLLTSAGATPGWDPLSRGRTAIEIHSQDRHRESVDLLIDAARDSIEALIYDGNPVGEGYVSAWAASGIPVLQRLAIHAWTHRSDRDDTAKIVWLKEREWLFQHPLRHEVFRLMATALPHAATEVANALVEDALHASVEAVDDENRAYVRFNALAWISQHAPMLGSARSAVEQIKLDYPKFEERSEPDLLSRMEFGAVQPKPPMTSVELHDRIAESAVAAMAEIRQYEGREFYADGPTWRDTIGVLIETVRDYPNDGFIILNTLSDTDRGIAGAVVSGWSSASIDTITAEQILSRLVDIDISIISNELSQLLVDGGADAHPTEWHKLLSARKLAVTLWETLDSVPPDSGIEDWLHHAVNRPAGKLALFWVHAIAAEWKSDADNWTGLSQDMRRALELMLGGGDAQSACTETVFASQLLFFFEADREWCEVHILPLLDWAEPQRAHRAWDGYLIWGRFNDPLLSAGLLRHYLDTARRADEFRGDQRRQLFSNLAALALVAGHDPLPWLRTLTSSTNVECRVEWMNQVAWMLNDLTSEEVEHQWQRWIKPYWEGRLHSIPRELTTEETSAMAPWVIFLTESIDEAVELATKRLAGLSEHDRLLYKLDSNLLKKSPTSIAKLVAHLLTGTEKPFYGCYHLSKIVDAIRGEAQEEDIAIIAEQAHRLGCHNATQWLD